MKTINKILVAIDLDVHDSPAVPYAFALASQLGAELILSYVVDKDRHASPSYIDLTPVTAGSALENEKSSALYALSRLVPPEYASVPHVAEPVVDTDIVRGIIKSAAEMGADMIITTTHDRGVIGGLLHGSVTQKLMHAAHCPVLVIKSK